MNSRQAMDNYNYYRDSRVVASFRSSLLEDINLRSMTADFRHYTSGEEQVDEVKLRFEVCPACQGSGKMVRPVIDAGGLTQEDVKNSSIRTPVSWIGIRQGIMMYPALPARGVLRFRFWIVRATARRLLLLMTRQSVRMRILLNSAPLSGVAGPNRSRGLGGLTS